MNALLLAAVLLGQCQTIAGQAVCQPPKARVAAPASLRTDKHGICVRVIAPEGSGVQSWGSGTLIGGDQSRAYVLTNRHVVGTAAQVIIWHKSGPFVGRVLRTSARADLAIIAIRRPSYVWPVALAEAPPRGVVRAFGFPGAGNILVEHTGRLSWANGPDYEAFDFPIGTGESGAGVFNAAGELVGVAFGSDPNHTAYSVAVSQPRLLEFLGVELCDRKLAAAAPFFLRYRQACFRLRAQINTGAMSASLGIEPRPAVLLAQAGVQDIGYNPPPNFSEAVPPPEIALGPMQASNPPAAPAPMITDLPGLPGKNLPPVSKVIPSLQSPPPTQLPAERTPRLATPQTLPSDTPVPGPMMAAPMTIDAPVTIDLPLTARVQFVLSIIRRGAAETR